MGKLLALHLVLARVVIRVVPLDEYLFKGKESDRAYSSSFSQNIGNLLTTSGRFLDTGDAAAAVSTVVVLNFAVSG